MPIRYKDLLYELPALFIPQPSVTTWHRLEADPSALDLAPGLEACVADPLWMIGRQWQLGELKGEDAGTPIQAFLHGSSSRLTIRNARSGGNAADALWEPTVEAEPQAFEACRGLAAGAGADFERCLVAEGAGGLIPVFRVAFPFILSDQAINDDEEDTAIIVLARNGTVDGQALFTALAPHLDANRAVTSFPVAVQVPADIADAARRAATDWMTQWDEFFVVPMEPSAWVDRRLEYQFDVDTDAGNAARSLHVEEYANGRLDWWSMDFGAPSAAPANAPFAVRGPRIPVPVRYAGMPADRYFEFEDGSVNFASTSGGPTSITTMLVLEYVLAASNDWFHVPLTLEYGHSFSLEKLTITDTFGRTADIRRAERGPGGWTMFELSLTNDPDQTGSTFVLPSVVAQTLEGEPIEEVAFFRDEMANLVWATERLIPGLAPKGIARRDAETVLHQAIDTTGLADAAYVYRMQTPVPLNWYPMTAEQVLNAPLGTVRFRRRDLRRTLASDEAGARTDDGKPKGILLKGKDGRFELEEAEVPRAGVLLTRSFQMARTADGRRLLWLGRSKRVGRGEGSSALRYDVLESASLPA